MKVLKIKGKLFLETTVNIQSIYNHDGNNTWYHLIPLGKLEDILVSMPSPVLEDLYFLSGSILQDRDMTVGLEKAVSEWEKEA